MIAQVNISKILNFKYNPERRPSGVINGIHWTLQIKKQISNELFRYTFDIRINDTHGVLLSGTRTMITGDIDIREAAEMTLRDEIDYN